MREITQHPLWVIFGVSAFFGFLAVVCAVSGALSHNAVGWAEPMHIAMVVCGLFFGAGVLGALFSGV